MTFKEWMASHGFEDGKAKIEPLRQFIRETKAIDLAKGSFMAFCMCSAVFLVIYAFQLVGNHFAK